MQSAKISRLRVMVCGAFSVLLACLSMLSPRSSTAHEHSADMPVKNAMLGAVSFEISCRSNLQADFNHGVALLHSFWHSDAQKAFEAVAAADPHCAMAYWGIAMSHFRLGLSWPSPADLTAGRAAITQAQDATEKTPRESEYVAALRALYDEFKPEEASRPFKNYSQALGKIAADYPSDVEAKVFQGLALILAQQQGDVNLIEMKQAAKILTPLLNTHPDHPGIAHYLIHATDAPGMAQEGLAAARVYAKIAPAAPHALHMPSHIFTRLGLWREDIHSNLASKAAAEQIQSDAENQLHAMEFLEYAYLQIGHDDEARAIMEEAEAIPVSAMDPRYGTYYQEVQTRFRTLYAIETHDWPAAARLEPTVGEADSFARGMTLLAHAMAAGHLKDRALAEATLRASMDYQKERNKGAPLPESGTPQAGFIDEIQAWTDFAAGNLSGAALLLRPIAEREARAGKGELELPVREMLAEMLLLSGQPQEALQQYQLSLKTDPNRFSALLGALNAAEGVARGDLAKDYYRQLLASCEGATGPAVNELKHAKLMVDHAARSQLGQSDHDHSAGLL